MSWYSLAGQLKLVSVFDVPPRCTGTVCLRSGGDPAERESDDEAGVVEIQGEGDMGPFTVAITGGTGAFRGAGGEARIRDVSDTVTVYKLFFDGTSRKRHRT